MQEWFVLCFIRSVRQFLLALTVKILLKIRSIATWTRITNNSESLCKLKVDY